MNFINTLNLWQWAMVLAIPPAIVALYFLKLRRMPLEVPSTYLWRRTIEDLHVNSLWQRLRKSILLLLQLLVMLLVIFALLRPGWQSAGATGNRFVILIDNSASMSSKDVEPTRLEAAKARALEVINDMDGGDVAMIVAFNDRAVPVQQFTSNKYELRRKLKAIEPTNRTSDISEALRLASGLANPGRFGEKCKENEVAVAEAQPAELFILTDGRFSEVVGFDFGNLTPQYIIIGDEQPQNVGITSFSIARNEERPDKMQAVCRVENFGSQELESIQVSMYVNDEPRASDSGTDKFTNGVAGVAFDISGIETGVLRVELEHKDAFPGDNVAYAAVNSPRRANVLLISPGNDALTFACQTIEAQKAANVTIEGPDYLKHDEYKDLAASAHYDLIIYDQCAPEVMPNSNTLFIGTLPPGTMDREAVAAEEAAEEPTPPAEETTDGETHAEDPSSETIDDVRRAGVWLVGPKQPAPAVIDTDRTHPLMRYIEMGNVRVAEAVPLQPPPGGSNLIDTDIGTTFAIAPRKSFEDAVLGFEIVGTDEEGAAYANTDWPIRRSFPLFIINVLQYLGGQSGSLATESIQPGRNIDIRSDNPNVAQVNVVDPAGNRTKLDRRGQATFPYNKTDQLGVYKIFEGEAKQPSQRFAVNLFDPNESNIVPREELQVGQAIVEGQRHWEPMRFELWKWILIGGLGLLLVEWWIWNRRVYL